MITLKNTQRNVEIKDVNGDVMHLGYTIGDTEGRDNGFHISLMDGSFHVETEEDLNELISVMKELMK